jgi:hypothetical protein
LQDILFLYLKNVIKIQNLKIENNLIDLFCIFASKLQ